MKKKLVVLGAMALLLVTVTQVFAATIGIDNFNEANQEVCMPITACVSAVSSSSVATTDAIGGTRDVIVVRTSGTNAVSAKSGDASDYFSYSAGNFTQGTLEVVWDGDNDPSVLNYTGLGGKDLTNLGTNTGIYFREVYNDLAFTIRVELYTDVNNWSYGLVAIPAAQSGTNFNIPFSSLLQGGSGPASLNNIGAIRLMAGSGVTALDFSVDYMAADNQVPTAVNLQSFTPAANSTLPVIGFVGFLALAIVSLGAIIVRREQKRA